MSDERDHLPKGRQFSDDQSGLPESPPLNPLLVGCLAYAGYKLGCLLMIGLLLLTIIIAARLGAFG